MTSQIERHVVHKAIMRPMLWLKLERPVCALVVGVSLVPWGLAGGLGGVIGTLLFFGVIYPIARLATKHEPRMLEIVWAAWRTQRPAKWWQPLRTQFDPLKHDRFEVEAR